MIYSATSGLHRTITEKILPELKYGTATVGVLLFTLWVGMIWYAASHHLLPDTNKPGASHSQSASSQVTADQKNVASKTAGATSPRSSTTGKTTGNTTTGGGATAAALTGSNAGAAVGGTTAALIGGMGGGGGDITSTIPSGTPSTPVLSTSPASLPPAPSVSVSPPSTSCLCQTVNNTVNTVTSTTSQAANTAPLTNTVNSTLPKL